MAISTPALLLSFLCFSLPAWSLYSPSGPVTILNAKTFDQKIRNSKHASFVEFFAPWCGHCKNLAPAYTKAAEHMAGIFTFAAIDCDDQANRALCAEFDIKGFPTIKFMKPFHGKVDALDYNGPRTAKGLTDFAKQNMENLVVRLTDENLSSFLQNNNETAKAIMFSEKGTTSSLWKSLAIEFQGQVILAQTRDTQKNVVNEFNVEKYPTLLVLPGGSTPGIVYSGPMERDPMYKFLSEYAPVAKVEETPVKESPAVKPKQEPLVDYTPKKISDFSELWETCFETHGTCYLLLSSDEPHVNAIAAIRQRLRATKTPMRIYSTELFVGKESLFEEATVPTLVAVNGAKGWYKKYEGTFGEKEVSAWMDAVKMGEGKKLGLSPDKVKEVFGVSHGSESKATSSTESASKESHPAEVSPSMVEKTDESMTAPSSATASTGTTPAGETDSKTALASESSMTETSATTSEEMTSSTTYSKENESETATSSTAATPSEAMPPVSEAQSKTASLSESATTETATTTGHETPLTTSDEGVKEVFGDQKEPVHDEL